ncbi:MAG: hypothetical protein AB8B65_13750 [Kordia sp.]|uniref:hypothetical protein n=1 Tax=Kordia sp. TaxID=1965332 RepID=UPI00385A5822
MNLWKLKYNTTRVKLIKTLQYLKYRIKTFLGFKTVGFEEPMSLVAFNILKKHDLSKFTMSIANYPKSLEAYDLEKEHATALRINGEDCLTIHLSPKEKQVKLTIGKNIRGYISNESQLAIENKMMQHVSKNEILSGLEIGLKKIKQCIVD